MTASTCTDLTSAKVVSWHWSSVYQSAEGTLLDGRRLEKHGAHVPEVKVRGIRLRLSSFLWEMGRKENQQLFRFTLCVCLQDKESEVLTLRKIDIWMSKIAKNLTFLKKNCQNCHFFPNWYFWPFLGKKNKFWAIFCHSNVNFLVGQLLWYTVIKTQLAE